MTYLVSSLCRTPVERVCFGFLLLLIYSFLGWCGEMVYCSLGQRRLCEKRGFLNGLICPIYGHGALLVLLVLQGGCENPVWTFFWGAILTSLVEYLTSYVMEKLFRMRWWDYSGRRFNLNGRICLRNSALFGAASVALCHGLNPIIVDALGRIFAVGAGVPLAVVFAVVYAADIVLSVRSAIQIGDRLARLHAIHDELTRKLAELKAEEQQRLENVKAEAQQKLTELKAEEQQRLENAKAEAQQKLRAIYDKQDFFERRLMHSFPAMRSPRYPEALKKLLEYRKKRK